MLPGGAGGRHPWHGQCLPRENEIAFGKPIGCKQCVTANAVTPCDTAGAIALANGITSARRRGNSARNHQRCPHLNHRAAVQAVCRQEIITIHPKTGRHRTGAVSRLNFIPAPLGNPALSTSLAWNLQFLADANHGFSVQTVNRNQFAAVHPKSCCNPTSRIPGTHRVLHRTPSAGFGRQHSEPGHMVGPTALTFRKTQTVAIRNKTPTMPDKSGQSRVERLQLSFRQTKDALHPGN